MALSAPRPLIPAKGGIQHWGPDLRGDAKLDSLLAVRCSLVRSRHRAGTGSPQRKRQLDVLGLLLEMGLDRAADDLGQRRQWLSFVELRISNRDRQQAPIFPFEADGRFHPGCAFEIGLHRPGVFPSFDQRADHAAGGKAKDDSDERG
jgi:hypothetical protein